MNSALARAIASRLRANPRLIVARSAVYFEALDPARFVLGSAVNHSHDLVLGHYSVHTNRQALATGEAEIRRIGRDLAAQGRLITARQI